MPELHKLTPPLGVLQDRGHRVALVTDGRMSGASGKIPAAIHVTPEAAADASPIARLRDGDRGPARRRRGHASRCSSTTPSSPPVRPPPRRTARSSAPAGSCSSPSATPSARPTRAPASSETPHDVHAPRRVLDVAPVIPVVVLDDADQGRAAGPRARRGRPADRRADPAHARRRWRRSRRIAAEVPEVLVGAGTILSARQAQRAAAAGAQFLVSPGSTPALLDAMDDTGLPYLPGHVDRLGDAGRRRARAHGDEVLPGRGRGRGAVPGVAGQPAAAPAVLPDRRHHGGVRAAATCGCRTSAASAAPGSPRPTPSPRATGPGSPRWPPRSRAGRRLIDDRREWHPRTVASCRGVPARGDLRSGDAARVRRTPRTAGGRGGWPGPARVTTSPMTPVAMNTSAMPRSGPVPNHGPIHAGARAVGHERDHDELA